MKFFILIILIFLPWAFGTVEDWSIGIALSGIGLGILYTGITQPKEFLKQSRFLFIYWFLLLILFGGYCFNPIELDIFSVTSGNISFTPQYSFLPASLSPTVSLNRIILWAGWGGMAWLVFFHFRHRESLKWFVIILLINAILLSIVAIAQKVTHAEKILWFRPITFFWDPNLPKPFVGPFVNRNHFAIYINVIWPMVFPLFYFLSKRYRSQEVKKNDSLLLIGLILGVLFGGIFISASRGGFLTTCVMGMGTILLFPRVLNIVKWYYWTGILLAGLLAFWLFGQKMLIRLVHSFGSTHDSVGNDGRWMIWKDSIHIIESNPLFGWGPGCFQKIFAFFKEPSFIYKIEYAHNDYIESLVETGFSGLFFWIVMIGTSIGYLLYRQRLLQSRLRKTLCNAAFLSAFGMLFHAFFDFPFQMGGLSLTFAAFLGLGFASIDESNHHTPIIDAKERED